MAFYDACLGRWGANNLRLHSGRTISKEQCVADSDPPADSASLFLSSRPLVSYCTAPAKWRMTNEPGTRGLVEKTPAVLLPAPASDSSSCGFQEGGQRTTRGCRLGYARLRRWHDGVGWLWYWLHVPDEAGVLCAQCHTKANVTHVPTVATATCARYVECRTVARAAPVCEGSGRWPAGTCTGSPGWQPLPGPGVSWGRGLQRDAIDKYASTW